MGIYCAPTGGLDVNAAGGSLHEAGGHLVVAVLLTEPGILVAHHPFLQHKPNITQLVRSSDFNYLQKVIQSN